MKTAAITVDFPAVILPALDAAPGPLLWSELLWDCGYAYEPYGWHAAMVRLIQRGEIRRDVHISGRLVFARRRASR